MRSTRGCALQGTESPASHGANPPPPNHGTKLGRLPYLLKPHVLLGSVVGNRAAERLLRACLRHGPPRLLQRAHVGDELVGELNAPGGRLRGPEVASPRSWSLRRTPPPSGRSASRAFEKAAPGPPAEPLAEAAAPLPLLLAVGVVTPETALFLVRKSHLPAFLFGCAVPA